MLSIFIYNYAILWRNKKSNCQRVSNIKPFINIFNLDGVDYPTSTNEYNKFEERNNWDIGLFVLYVDVEVKSFKYNNRKYTNNIN